MYVGVRLPGRLPPQFARRRWTPVVSLLTITIDESDDVSSERHTIGADRVHGNKDRALEIVAGYHGVTATASDVTERYYSLYTPELTLLAETASTTAQGPPIAYEYIWFEGQPLAQVDVGANQTQYYVNDHPGTPLLQTDATARVVWKVEYEPFGTVHAFRSGDGKHQPLRFPGQEVLSVDSDLTYNVFRWYRSGFARFTQPDPITSLDYDQLMMRSVENTYAYVDGNPLTFIDPWGLTKTKPGKPPNPKDWKKNCENAKPLSKDDPGACQYGSQKAQPPAKGLWDPNTHGKDLDKCIWEKCCTPWFQKAGS